MINQMQIPTAKQLKELTNLYYMGTPSAYDVMLQSTIEQLRHMLPDYTIAFAEIYTAGTERQAYSGMCHVIVPIERNAR